MIVCQVFNQVNEHGGSDIVVCCAFRGRKPLTWSNVLFSEGDQKEHKSQNNMLLIKVGMDMDIVKEPRKASKDKSQ